MTSNERTQNLTREFHLSPHGTGGVACDGAGALIGAVPLVARARTDGTDEWRPRECDELSEEMSAQYGLPVDMSSKSGGLMAIAKALNDGDVARAQIATVLLGIPDPPLLSKGEPSHERMIELIRDLQWSGMLKWDSDEHPRWPAGSSEGKGGEFTPKGESGDTSDSQSDTDDRAGADNPQSDRTVSDIRNLFDDARAGGASGDPAADDAGIYADYGHHIGDVQFASTAIPMGSFGGTGITLPRLENWVRLANGALELGPGEIITAAALLSAYDRNRQLEAVNSAIVKFGLDPSQAGDVLAARAYVWSNTAAPWNFQGVPQNGPKLEAVSRSIMLLELARPGTLYFATQGDRLSTNYLNVAAQEGLSDAAVLESRIRLPNAPVALQSTSAAARSAADLRTNDKMQAHHLVPVNVIGANLALATLASEAGWKTDSPQNLIGLPADVETQKEMLALDLKLPIQNSWHPNYDVQTEHRILQEISQSGKPSTPIAARKILDDVADWNRARILAGDWFPVLKVGRS